MRRPPTSRPRPSPPRPDPPVDLEALRTGPLADARAEAEPVDAATPYEGAIFQVRRDTVRLDGATFTREYTTHHGAVAVLPVDELGRVLLINQYRHPTRRRSWEIPAGLLDVAGEDPLTAAKRELAEETDLVAATWSEPLEFDTSPGQSDERIVLFEARDLSPAPTAHERTDEEAGIVLRWVELDEAVEAALAGRLGNAILLVAILAAHARR
ncbi:MAG: NUDIX hydrolase [Microbacteriaceae bacterium]|nr:NUDIX hydrolase [Microbacteriaceae bacterium]